MNRTTGQVISSSSELRSEGTRRPSGTLRRACSYEAVRADLIERDERHYTLEREPADDAGGRAEGLHVAEADGGHDGAAPVKQPLPRRRRPASAALLLHPPPPSAR